MHIQSLAVGISELDPTASLHRKEEVFFLFPHIYDRIVVLTQNPEVLFLHKEIEYVIHHKYSQVVVLH